MVVAAVAVVAILLLGDMWWTSIATANASDNVYKAPPVEGFPFSGSQLVLKMGASLARAPQTDQLDNIIPDHGHLMHLFLVRMPEMDDFYHLHPDESATGRLREIAGRSRRVLCGVRGHRPGIGFPDTMTAKIDLPARHQRRAADRRRFEHGRAEAFDGASGRDDSCLWARTRTSSGCSTPRRCKPTSLSCCGFG